MNKLRGIDIEFAEVFKKCKLYDLYKEHKDELFIGIRDNYLNLYYNCDSIAKIKHKENKSISCEIDRYYLDGKHYKGKGKIAKNLQPGEIYDKYIKIKSNSDDKKKAKKDKKEKRAQAKLIINNNKNESSKWFCIDIEYAIAYKNKAEKEKAGCSPRFDIIAISKASPHKVALIEIKYGHDAIGGKSGIYKHIEDDYKFCKKGFFERQLKQEIVNIIESLYNIGVKIPFNIPELSSILPDPDFYFITLNNAKKGKASTPKQSMGGYLFNDKRWGTKKFIKNKPSIQSKFGDVTKKSSKFYATFLFSEENLEKGITINDIINGDYDERIIPE